MVALDTLPLSPSSQVIAVASSAVLACHQVSATTATAVSFTLMTFFTPGIFIALASSKLVTLAPNTGASLIAAQSMPGSFTSIANTLEPLSLSAVSSRLSGLPAIVQVFGSFNVIDFGSGGVILEAAPAIFP